MLLKPKGGKRNRLQSSQNAARIFREFLLSCDEVERGREHVWAIGVDTKLQLIYAECVSVGTVDASLVCPRQVLRRAVQNNAVALFLAHNHPSGDVCPSPQDFDATDRIKDAGRCLGIDVIDHVVICETSEQYASIAELRQKYGESARTRYLTGGDL